MEENKQDFKVSIVNFARDITPLPIEVKQGQSDDKYVKYGSDNLYPNLLLQLYNENSLHNGIIKTKVNHVMGDGLVIKSSGKKADFDINIIESFEEIARKLVLDILIFGYFSLEIQYNQLGDPILMNHLPAHHLRANEILTKFWICKDWSLKRNVLSFDRWKKGTNEDGKSKVYMFSAYNPSVNNVYPIVSYNAAITNMVTEGLINSFNKNNVEDSFSPTNIVSFFKGIPTAEQAKELERKFEANFKGTNGKKFIINHNEAGSEKGIQVDSVSSVDFASALASVRETNIEAILTVHQATSRILFGIEVPGSLGDRTSIQSSFELFKGLFVKDTRNIIESGLNKILIDFGLDEVEFKDKSKLFTEELSDTTREKVLTIDELRSIDNRPPLPNNEGTKLLASATPIPTFSLATPSANASNFNFATDDKYKYGRILNEEDFELVKDMGTSKADFEIVSESNFHAHSIDELRSLELQFDDEKDVDNYLLENKLNGKTIAEIKADIKKELAITVTSDDLETRIKALTKANVIESDVIDGKVKIEPVEPEKRKQVEVLYEYKVKPNLGKPIISTSRGFCVKLIENDRLYTRSQINEMSSIFGYSVFLHSGGWYFNPDTQKSENQCRHYWNKVSVIRKGAKA
jgi:hypothetical protein